MLKPPILTSATFWSYWLMVTYPAIFVGHSFGVLVCDSQLPRRLTVIALAFRYQVTLAQELLILFIRLVSERGFCGMTEKMALRRELVQRLAVGDATHSSLLKALPPRLQDSKHLQECLDAVATYCNPSGMQQVSLSFCSSTARGYQACILRIWHNRI